MRSFISILTLYTTVAIPIIDIYITNHKCKSQCFVAKTNETNKPMTISYTWELDSYICSIYPNKTRQHYYCNHKNTIPQNSISSKPEYSISLQYNSPSRVIIDSIKVILSNNLYYEMNLFCVPWQYSHFQFDITTKRWNTCKTKLSVDGINDFRMPQYDNIAIGEEAGITLHRINFIDDILNYPNQWTEGILLPPRVTRFGIKVANLPKEFDPQTRHPITLSLYWYDKFYQCIIRPIEINGTYICDVISSNISMCDVNKSFYGKYMLFMEKQTDNTDALIIDEVIVYDETGTFYGIKHFCVSQWDHDTTQMYHSKKFIIGKCNGYLGYWHSNIDTVAVNEYTKYNLTCIDSDNCGLNKILYYFPNNLYKRNNSFMQAVTINGIIYNAGYCDIDLGHMIEIEPNVTNLTNLTNNTKLGDDDNNMDDEDMEFSSTVQLNDNVGIEEDEHSLNDHDIVINNTHNIDESVFLNQVFLNQYQKKMLVIEIIVGILVFVVSIILYIILRNKRHETPQRLIQKPLEIDGGGSSTETDGVSYNFEHISDSDHQSMEVMENGKDDGDWDCCDEYECVISEEENDETTNWSKIDMKHSVLL